MSTDEVFDDDSKKNIIDTRSNDGIIADFFLQARAEAGANLSAINSNAIVHISLAQIQKLANSDKQFIWYLQNQLGLDFEMIDPKKYRYGGGDMQMTAENLLLFADKAMSRYMANRKDSIAQYNLCRAYMILSKRAPQTNWDNYFLSSFRSHMVPEYAKIAEEVYEHFQEGIFPDFDLIEDYRFYRLQYLALLDTQYDDEFALIHADKFYKYYHHRYVELQSKPTQEDFDGEFELLDSLFNLVRSQSNSQDDEG